MTVRHYDDISQVHSHRPEHSLQQRAPTSVTVCASYTSLIFLLQLNNATPSPSLPRSALSEPPQSPSVSVNVQDMTELERLEQRRKQVAAELERKRNLLAKLESDEREYLLYASTCQRTERRYHLATCETTNATTNIPPLPFLSPFHSTSARMRKPTVEEVMRRTEGLERTSPTLAGLPPLADGDGSDADENGTTALPSLRRRSSRLSPRLSPQSRRNSRVLESVERLTSRLSIDLPPADAGTLDAAGVDAGASPALNGDSHSAEADNAAVPLTPASGAGALAATAARSGTGTPDALSSDSDFDSGDDAGGLLEASTEETRERRVTMTRPVRPLLIRRRSSAASPAGRPQAGGINKVDEV